MKNNFALSCPSGNNSWFCKPCSAQDFGIFRKKQNLLNFDRLSIFNDLCYHKNSSSIECSKILGVHRGAFCTDWTTLIFFEFLDAMDYSESVCVGAEISTWIKKIFVLLSFCILILRYACLYRFPVNTFMK